MTPSGRGYDPDIGPRTGRGEDGFIGRRRQAEDLNAPGAGEVQLDPDAESDVGTGVGDGPPPAIAGPGAPGDLERGERNSPLTDS
jgi:hypothetical protein